METVFSHHVSFLRYWAPPAVTFLRNFNESEIFTAGGPNISETVRDEKNGFHIRNQRGQFSQERVSK